MIYVKIINKRDNEVRCIMCNKNERMLIMKLIRVFPGKTLAEIKNISDYELLTTRGIGRKLFEYVKSLECQNRFNVEQLKHMSYVQRIKLGQKHLIKNMRKQALYVIIFCLLCSTAHAFPGIECIKAYNENKVKYTASYYTYESCRREGTSGVWTASTERYDENDLTCAMRRRDWGGVYKVTNLDNGKSVIVRHNDFGPNKKLHDSGRIVDLSKAAFAKIANLKQGVINVKVEKIK